MSRTRKQQSSPSGYSLGVCFYPEQWPRDRWAPYARQMRALGLTYVRVGDFTWSDIEPRPGELVWDWLDEAIDILAAEDLRVVIATPTAAPPPWLARAYPDMLPVDREGRRLRGGSRRHCDLASENYRREAARICGEFARRYGIHPAVAGWQIDNELGDHDTGRSCSPAALDRFRTWLEHRYGDIATLDDAWGACFWSQRYTTWEEVDLPNLTVAGPNPAHVLDFYRFSSDLITEFLSEHAAIIRAHSPNRWVTHNFMRFCDQFDHYPAAESLDFVTWDSYPTGGVEYADLPLAERAHWARTGEPDLISVNHDLYRGIKPAPHHPWVMEQQAGQINWAPSNPLPADGAVDLWTAQTWAHGGACTSYFRWRAATIGQELTHSGLLRHDETLDRGAEEVATFALNGAKVVAERRAVVLLHDYESLWLYDEQPQSAGASYWKQFMLFYSALRGMGIDVDIRHPDADLSGYRLVVAPALQLMSAERARRLESVARRARMVFGPRTGFRDMNGKVHPGGQPGPLANLLGCRLGNFDAMPPLVTASAGGHVVETWAESYRPAAGSSVVAYDDGPLRGMSAVVRHGNCLTIGAWGRSLIEHLLAIELRAIGIEPMQLPDGLRRVATGERTIWLNFTATMQRTPAGLPVEPVSWRMEPSRKD
jgi:beta-galactosidase